MRYVIEPSQLKKLEAIMAKISKSDAEWRAQLTAEAYDVCRQKGTERPFSGAYNSCYDKGTYICICCGNPLFSSDTKFDSGTGWPSFYKPLSETAIRNEEDKSLFMTRVETLCNQCDAHLGHVFPDGPEPTGLRYCMNSVALKLIQQDDGRD